jgi:hypothetical protein
MCILHRTSKTSYALFKFFIRALFAERNSHVVIGALVQTSSRINEIFISIFLIVFEFATEVLKSVLQNTRYYYLHVYICSLYITSPFVSKLGD